MVSIMPLILLMTNSSLDRHCKSEICIWQYTDINRPYPVGCNETSMRTTGRKSRISCAMSCTDDLTCAAFVYSGQLKICSICQGNLIQQLNFSSDVLVFWKMQNTMFNIPFPSAQSNMIDKIVAIENRIYIGSVIHLQGYFYNFEGFYVELRQNSTKSSNIIFHFRCRRDFDTKNPILVLNHYSNSQWDTETRPTMTPYPFSENTTFTVDILVGYTGYQVYIDHVYCCIYPYYLSYSDSYYLGLNGSIKVYEWTL